MYTDAPRARACAATGTPHAIGFKDAAGRWWDVKFFPEAVKVARDRGTDCRALAHGGAANFHEIVELLALACHRQTEARRLTAAEFVKLVADPATFTPACEALAAALAAYYPVPPAQESSPC
ncbi:hypothetical protein [Gemmata sp.]|uniref:hypothetical protein n=1 Tax=Gemmata sp. TaxID=1914242 RepID=UPI003F6F6AAA